MPQVTPLVPRRRLVSINNGVSLAGGLSGNFISNSNFTTNTSTTPGVAGSLINSVVHGASWLQFECDIYVRRKTVQPRGTYTGLIFAIMSSVTGPNASIINNSIAFSGRANILNDLPLGGANVLPFQYPIEKWFRLITKADYANRYTEITVDDWPAFRLSYDMMTLFNSAPATEVDVSTAVSSRSGFSNGSPNALPAATGYGFFIGGNGSYFSIPAAFANTKLSSNLGTATFPLNESGNQFYSLEHPAGSATPYYLTLSGPRG